MFDYFICYHPESGCHVTRHSKGLSLRRGKSLGTRLGMHHCIIKCYSSALHTPLGFVKQSKTLSKQKSVLHFRMNMTKYTFTVLSHFGGEVGGGGGGIHSYQWNSEDLNAQGLIHGGT